MKIHIVKEGESFYLIGQKYGVTVEELKKLNPSVTDDKNLQIGAKIKVPSEGEKPWSGGLIHKYTVKAGDTLWKLSKAWGVPLNELIKANSQLTNPDALHVGDTVNIPKQKESTGLSPEHKAEHHGHAGGKAFTGPIVDGKKNTAPIEEKPPAAVKPPTAVKPPEPVPVLPPAPPVPPALPAEEKTYAKPYESHYTEKAIHPFAQEKVPAVEAVAPLYELPKMPEYAPAPSYGSGYSKPEAGSYGKGSGYGNAYPQGGHGAHSAGYGQELPGLGGQMDGYGAHNAWPAAFSPAAGASVEQPYAAASPWMAGYPAGYGIAGHQQGYGHPGGIVQGAAQTPGDGYGSQAGSAGYDGYGTALAGMQDCYPPGYGAYGHGGYGHPGYGAEAQGYGGYGHPGYGAEAQGYGGYGHPGYGAEAQGYGNGYGHPGYGAEVQGYGGGYGHPGYGAQNNGAHVYGGGGYPQGIMPAAGAAVPGPYNYDGGGKWNAAGASAGASPAQWPGYPGWGAEAQGYPASPGGWPQTAAVQGYGVNPGYGGAALQEAAPVAVQPSCCGDRDEEEAQAAEKAGAGKPETKSKAEAKPAKTGTAAARKQPKKAVIRSASRPAPRASKGSKPWINR
ncbi:MULTISPECIES: LysM peptidoglycan-binding domain-containing protein [unclassified Paenibacillus]|uniref:LysM peptidoglycan-binding domain-containing protein n=1 Tax=unclassified Paenibacillus TaxID=185978 RepID=UPI0009545611|nr:MULTISPECIES: LysM peptidoglycan-binding domain-containing protein [unclassified Paenibacillus]ASS66314.2 LysM peptidoglycan-binding domain-containing protein [Paenibacillus sp. RUD330]SIQ08169.1 LysM repeat-containing protein [Paenibacillus sp. RU4X]SIQ28258.1 LysM repeat-containing protein [Paenibacillus sp. RU4T]